MCAKVMNSLLIGLISASSMAQSGGGGFVPGRVYVSETGTEGCLEERCWIREIDPNTGESWIFADHMDGLCSNSGLRFTPNHSRLRVLNLLNNTIQDYDADGNGTVVYGAADGLGGPFGGNGLLWNRRGDFIVANEYSLEVLLFPVDGGPPRVVVDSQDGVSGAGGLELATNSDLFVAGYDLLRISSDGGISTFDDYGLVEAHSLAFDRHGNLYVGAKDYSDGGRGVVRRYHGADPTTREVLISGLTAGDRVAIELSEDESTLYYAGNRNLIAIDLSEGSSRVIFTTPRDSDDFIRRLGRGIAVYKAPKPGDMNCDNWVNNFDIDPFVLALSDEAGYQARFGWCDRTRADMNADGAINSFDIDGFVAAVVGDVGE